VFLSPATAQAGERQLFTLVVQPERDDVVTTQVEFFPPPQITVDSFLEAEGWERDWTIQSAAGGKNIVQKAVWTRKDVPKEGEEREEAAENAMTFQFLGHVDTSNTYRPRVRQSFSDNSVIDWRGSEGSEHPAPMLAVSSDGDEGGGGTSVLAVVAVVLAGVALVLAGAALAAHRAGLGP
jgi:hypothetical protein